MRGRETGGAQFAITGATGQKVSKKDSARMCLHVHVSPKIVTECLCLSMLARARGVLTREKRQLIECEIRGGGGGSSQGEENEYGLPG